MSPSLTGDFWSHIPHWGWPIIVVGALGLAVYEAIRASETVARVFGRFGRKIYDRAKWRDRIQVLVETTNDKLECATAYLVLDAQYHREVDIIIAESNPGLTRFLPPRVSYTDFCGKWDAGWRPNYAQLAGG